MYDNLNQSDKTAYMNALKKLEEKGFEISENKHTGTKHAYFMYEVKDENAKINSRKKVNSIEFILIRPSYGHGHEIRIRETLDVTAPYPDCMECTTKSLAVLDLEETESLAVLDLEEFEGNIKDVHINGIVNTAINIINEFIDDKVLLMFDTFTNLERSNGEIVRSELVDYLAYNLVSYYDDETGELFEIPLGSPAINFIIQKLD